MESVSDIEAQSRITLIPYSLEWRFGNFSKVPRGKPLVSPDFFPLAPNAAWTLKFVKTNSNIEMNLHNVLGTNVKMESELSIFDIDSNLKKRWTQSHEFTRNSTVCNLTQAQDGYVDELDRLTNDELVIICRLKLFKSVEVRGMYRKVALKESKASKLNLQLLSLDLISMFESSMFTDVSLRCKGEVIRAHRCILSARSPVFLKMFENEMLESVNRIVDIDDLELQVLKNFLHFLYTGVLSDCSFKAAYALYYAADKYDVLQLRELCVVILMSQIEASNACQTLVLADRHNNKDLKKMVLQYIKAHWNAVLATEGWEKLVCNATKFAAEVVNVCIGKQ